MKLDIEGFELLALKGLERTVAKNKPLILREFNPRCLASNANTNPEQFADQVFGLADDIEAIEHDGRTSRVTRAVDLVQLWKSKNERAAQTGFLPDGMLHFDLLFKARL